MALTDLSAEPLNFTSLNPATSATSAKASDSSRLDGIQVMRAVAALMVVIHHAESLVGFLSTSEAGLPKFTFFPLWVGVDIFFVISGFIVVYASERLFGTKEGVGEFLRRRLTRIVPLYWTALVLRLVLLFVGSKFRAGEVPNMTDIVTSFLFIPHDSQGLGGAFPFPILDVGWSLNYEMFFYAILAAVIFLPRDKAVAAIVAFLFLTATVFTLFPTDITPLRFWTQPMTLEFAAGALLAMLYRRGVTLPKIAPLIAIPCALVLITTVKISDFYSYPWFAGTAGPSNYSWARVLIAGSCAVLLIGSLTLPRFGPAPSWLRWAVHLGDSSYALYLFHPLIFSPVRVVFRRVHLSNLQEPLVYWSLVLLMTAIAVVASHIVHKRFEMPLQRLLTRKKAAGPAVA